MNQILIPVAVGEVFDKISILEIKNEKIVDEKKLVNIKKELELLRKIVEENEIKIDAGLYRELKSVNLALWDVEDSIRDRERIQDFGEEFVSLARKVYVQNDKRYVLKMKINEALGSGITEEKSYSSY